MLDVVVPWPGIGRWKILNLRLVKSQLGAQRDDPATRLLWASPWRRAV